MGVDILEVIAAANSQPYSHIHQPGIGVGGHCIPVYPHFLLDRAPELGLVALAREVNDGQVGVVIDRLAETLGELDGRSVLVLGSHLPPRRQGAGLFAGAAADRRACGARRDGSPTTRC